MAGETWTFVGRDRELGELLRAAEEAGRGRSGLWLVSGSAGMGKSRLTDELAAAAADRGLRVLWGRCWESGITPAYWPWIQVLRELLATPESRERLRGHHAKALAQLLPELWEPAAAPLSIDGDRARFQMVDAIAECLRTHSGEQPLLLILEDLHVADLSSLLALEAIGLHLRTAPVVTVGTCRPEETRDPELGQALQRLSRQGTSLPLAPLSREHVESFMASAFGRPPVPGLAATVHEATAGNPLFVAETIRLLAATPAAETPSSIGSLPVPASVRAVYEQRVGRLSPAAQDLLRLAAVFGRDFDVADLARLTESDGRTLADQLGEAVDAALIEELVAGRYQFAHILCREALYRGLSSNRRWRLHEQAADVLDHRLAAPGGDRLSDIANHLRRAGPAAAARAARACRAAGDEAMTRMAFLDAIDWYRRGLQAATRLPTDEPGLRSELMLAAGRAHIAAGRSEAGRELCLETAELARQVGDVDLLGRAALLCGTAFFPGQIDDELIELLETALSALPAGDHPLRARMLARLAAAQQPSPTPQQPIALAREAIAMARRLVDPEVLRPTLRSAVSAMLDLGDAAETVPLCREHLLLATSVGDLEDMWRAHLRLCIGYLELAQLADLDRQIASIEEVAFQIGHDYYRWPVLSFRFSRALVSGDYATATARLAELEALVDILGDRSLRAVVAMLSSGIARTRQRGDELAARLPTLERHTAGTIALPFLQAIYAGDLARIGDLDAANAALTTIDLDEAIGFGDCSVLDALGQVAVLRGDRELGRALYRRAEHRAGRLLHWGIFGGGLCDGAADRLLGQLAQLLGDGESADRHFRAAIDQLEALGMAPHLEHTRGLAGASASPPAPVPRTPAPSSLSSLSITRDGDVWLLVHQGGSFRLGDTKGVRLLAQLVERPGQEVHVFDLLGTPEETRDHGAGEAIDREARDAYRDRAREIEEELLEANDWNDAGRVEKLRAELEAIASELSRSLGLGGKPRQDKSTRERARINVQRRIKDAIKRIGEHDADLARRMDRAVKTGTFCCFEPL